MPAPFRTKVLAVTAKIESVSGTDSVPTTAANAVRVVGLPTLNYGYLEGGNRDDVQFGGLGAIERAAPAGRNISIDLTLEVKGFGAAYAAASRPESDVFLRGAGMSATVVTTGGSESVTYTTLDDGLETFSCYFYTASKLIKAVGCVAKPKLASDMNKRGFLTFGVQGRVVSDPIDTTLGAVTYNQTTPPLFHSAAAGTAIGTWTPATGEPLMLLHAEIDFGTVAVERGSAGATDGLVGYVITDRKARQMMSVEAASLSTFDPFAQSKTALAGMPLTNWQIGTAQYNRLKIFTGKWALETPALGDVSGLAAWDLAGNLVALTEPTSGRELRLVFD